MRVKNSYNVRAPGTLIGHVRPGGNADWLLTSIVRKSNVTMLDIVSTRMLVGPGRKYSKHRGVSLYKLGFKMCWKDISCNFYPTLHAGPVRVPVQGI